MGNRNRVLSFMSSFSNRERSPAPFSAQAQPKQSDAQREEFPIRDASRNRNQDMPTPPPHVSQLQNLGGDSPRQRAQRERAVSTSSRPMSMVQTYQPPNMEVSQDTLPELQPIFTFLNSHANKLYQEGYFLKLDDQNTHGRPNADRTWTECFAQLVGTVLSLWDAAELDAAGADGEVLPKFINLTDASIKMIESLPTRSDNEAPLQNVLSISTAGKNRYLLHFNSHHSLIQWTAGIRLAMFEHATLQEAYTGALIAGKGKALNNITTIMERARMPSADWARVRFGAGTPWRRCWCVISPPDEKEVQKMQKSLKKKSAYDRSKPPALKGDIKFYDSKKTKKVQPIATITDAYSAFAIYPQSKPLIDASTLVKVEGAITIHSDPPSTTEGFVFVMPEVHPAVSGFEMMLRWLFPTFDTFALYGRPGRLVAATEDIRSLMFAMPKQRRYGYLEILDVSGLILEPGSASWKEIEWRRRLKELTGKRMLAIEESSSRANSRYSGRRSARNSFGPSRTRAHFDDGASVRSQPSVSYGAAQTGDLALTALPRTDSAPPSGAAFTPPRTKSNPHHRSASDTFDIDRMRNRTPPNRYDGTYEQAPTPPPHAPGILLGQGSGLRHMQDLATTPERISSEDDRTGRNTPVRELAELQETRSPEPVATPPAFAHGPGAKPISKPYHSPELRRANSRMSTATLSQLAGAGGYEAAHSEGPRTSEDQRRQVMGRSSGEGNAQGVQLNTAPNLFRANDRPSEVVTAVKPRFSFENSPSQLRNFETTSSKLSPQLSSNSLQSLPTSPPLPPIPVKEQPITRTLESLPVSTSDSPFHSHPTDSTDSFVTAISTSHPLTAAAVQRKPLPAKPSTQNSSDPPSSTDTLASHVIDNTVYGIVDRGTGKLTPKLENQMHRQNSELSSYDDDRSNSLEYTSTRRSVDTRASMEKYRPDKPRAGVMKTVGNTGVGDLSHGSQAPVSPPFHIDFGPTINYARSPSPGPAKSYGRGNSPGPGMNHYPVNRAPRGGSPVKRPESGVQSGSPVRKPLPAMNNRFSTGEPRTQAWQPAAAAKPITDAQRAITPEQFVQQRANATPLYTHARSLSGEALGTGRSTPPLVRNRSSDRLAQNGHSRNNSTDRLAHVSHSRDNSTDLLQRPRSRNSTVLLDGSGNGSIPMSLSAREQEELARATGRPLINMAMNTNKPLPQDGLVGAINAREKDKQAMKQGLNSVAVQNALVQQHRQNLSQQSFDQGPRYYRTQSVYNMGQYPQSYSQTPAQSQQFPMSAAGGWSQPPAPSYAMQSEQGRQSPSQYPAQGQYLLPQQGGQERGNSGYQQGHNHDASR